MTNSYILVAASAHDLAIGRGRLLPWGRLQPDLRAFRLLTTAANPDAIMQALLTGADPDLSWAPALPQNIVLLGRTTWLSLPGTLPGRSAWVATRQMDVVARLKPGAAAYAPLDTLLWVRPAAPAPCFVIGGASIYQQMLCHPWSTALFLTEIATRYPDADSWFPARSMNWGHGWFAVETAPDVLCWWHRMQASPWHTYYGLAYRFTLWRPMASADTSTSLP